jgi:GT2 family glycosyltransferase
VLSETPAVSVIIPTWNRTKLVASVLDNLRQQTIAFAEVLVVDNGSTDDTVAIAERKGARVVALSQNRGFAAAVNAGILEARSDWLLILNNDVDLDPGWLETALNAAREESVHFVMGKLLQAGSPERLDGTWDLVSRAGCAWRCGWNAPDSDLWNKRRLVHFGSFTALLVHRSVFNATGLLDTRYDSYYEDVDFGIRCAIAGFSGLYEPAAVGRHLGSGTLGTGARSTYLVSRNQVLLASKFGLARLSLWRVLLGQTLFLLSRVRHRTLGAAIKGKWDGLRLSRSWHRYEPDLQHVREMLEESEADIGRFQKLTGFDLSWKLYFALCGRRNWPEL